MEKVVVYEKPTCTTCKNLFTVLTERGIDFEKVEYLINPISREKLADLARKTGSVRGLVRNKEPEYEALGVAHMSDDQILDVLAANPKLVQRPIVEIGERAIVARPAERVLDIL